MRKKYIIIGWAIILALLIGVTCTQIFVLTPMISRREANSLDSQRLAEINASSSAVTTSTDSLVVTSYQEFTPDESTDSSTVTSYQEFTPNESTDSSAVTSYQESTPNESTDSSTVTSYQESTPNESTDSSANAPEAVNFTAKIVNKRSTETRKPTSVQVFKDESEAFANAKYLSYGRYVSIILSTNSKVKGISSKVSMHNPETDLFEDFDSCDFEVSNTVNFKIPDNPYVGYNGNFIRCVIVVTVVTEDGTFYVGCSY